MEDQKDTATFILVNLGEPTASTAITSVMSLGIDLGTKPSETVYWLDHPYRLPNA